MGGGQAILGQTVFQILQVPVHGDVEGPLVSLGSRRIAAVPDGARKQVIVKFMGNMHSGGGQVVNS